MRAIKLKIEAEQVEVSPGATVYIERLESLMDDPRFTHQEELPEIRYIIYQSNFEGYEHRYVVLPEDVPLFEQAMFMTRQQVYSLYNQNTQMVIENTKKECAKYEDRAYHMGREHGQQEIMAQLEDMTWYERLKFLLNLKRNY